MDDKLQAARNRGVEAAARLEDEFLNKCLDDLLAGLVAVFLKSPGGPLGTPIRERARVLVDAIDMLRGLLREYRDGGKIAQADLERLMKLEG